MRYIISIVLIFITYFSADAQIDKGVSKDYSIHNKIPTEWVDKIHHFNYTRNTEGLLLEFDHFISPDSLVNPHIQHANSGYGRVLNAMFVNLDEEPGDELICLLGWDITCPYLGVFKERQGEWYLIYLEEIESFYSSPTLYVANCFSQNKTFYLRRVYNRGSGMYADGYSFYKLINNKVYQSLNLVNQANIIRPGPYMSQEVRMNFEFAGDDLDGIWVDYGYNFFNVPIVKDDALSNAVSPSNADSLPYANDEIPIIKGEGGTNYTWNNKNKTYDLDIKPYQNQPDDLTAQKIACFGDCCNVSLIVLAFRRQIDQTLKTGTPQQKKILKEYLSRAKINKPG